MPAQYIDDLLKNLNESEKRSISYHFTIRNASEDLLIKRYIETTAKLEDASEKPFIANRMLKSRAFDRLTDILVSDYHIHKKEYLAPNDQILIRLKKRMLLARVLAKSLNQGKTSAFKTILNCIISDAEKNEIYDVLIEALHLKKYTFSLKEGGREFEKIEKQITHFEACQKKIYFAGDCYYRIVINSNLLKFKTDKQFHNYIVKSIRILKSDYQKYKSVQINYYLHYILMFYFEKQKKYQLSAKYAKLLYEIVKSSPILYREERLGFALLNLSQYKTFTENYNDAARYAKEAKKHYLENSNNYIVSKEQEFNIYFYHKKYEKAAECIKELETRNILDSGQFVKAKYTYFKAALLFAQKEFKTSYSLLNKSLEIEKDKSSWNISLRIMNIMLCIELDKLDEAIRLLESLRKYIQRNLKSAEIKPRDVSIVKVLRELEKSDFSLAKRNKIIDQQLKELSTKGSAISWEHYSSELIPFHEWLESKKN